MGAHDLKKRSFDFNYLLFLNTYKIRRPSLNIFKYSLYLVINNELKMSSFFQRMT